MLPMSSDAGITVFVDHRNNDDYSQRGENCTCAARVRCRLFRDRPNKVLVNLSMLSPKLLVISTAKPELPGPAACQADSMLIAGSAFEIAIKAEKPFAACKRWAAVNLSRSFAARAGSECVNG